MGRKPRRGTRSEAKQEARQQRYLNHQAEVAANAGGQGVPAGAAAQKTRAARPSQRGGGALFHDGVEI